MRSGRETYFLVILAEDEASNRILRETFKLEEFRPQQKEVVDRIMNGKHTLALLPTGYGKSLCYQVPSQALPGVTLVISPLIALMQDQASSLAKRGITNATVLNSAVGAAQMSERLRGIQSGEFKLVYAAPERFDSPQFRALINNVSISLLVIDEAHCISQWGHDFRPHYRNINQHIGLMPDATVLALTATATPAVRNDIVQSLSVADMELVTTSFDRTNLRFEVRHTATMPEKEKLLLQALRADGRPAIVFTSSRRETERVAMLLKRERLAAGFYHAGMDTESRRQVQTAFETDRLRVIVSTVAFGMGIDKANIGTVVHFNLPSSVENYFQEAGRAGRNGEPATCLLLYQAKDIYTQKWLIEKNYCKPDEAQAVCKLLQSNSNAAYRPVEIASQTGVAESALNSALDLLKQLKLIVATEYGAYQWANVDPSSTGARGNVDMSLLYQRRSRDLARLERIVRYAQEDRCRRADILDYFGQKLEGPCAGCDACHGQSRFPSATAAPSGRDSKTVAPTNQPPPAGNKPKNDSQGPSWLTKQILSLVEELKGRYGKTTIVQVLAGSGSKKMKEAGFDEDDRFGSCKHLRQDDIKDAIDELVSQGKLRVIRGLYPKLEITPTGKSTLTSR
jgi:ATP-dependent DNA helicase RecQ